MIQIVCVCVCVDNALLRLMMIDSEVVNFL